ncbi:MAG TPA: alpha/beta fold hydrolase [Planctomycetota bacterium]|nr:alpha/beta fold hydrolase [Planctomycetota bacterium]HRR80604.1 alpha/beta fold hydrolase [Planctomycetota bacterium]HRT95331.1 alpha/beta fold hydrolase [Planctomycetota bacterium]
MPLTFDFPLERLKTYQGINPRPADFDAYWDRALAEMHALDPQVTLTPAEFQAPFAECFDLHFTGVGGARVYAKLLRPKSAPKPHPAVLLFHGYSGNSGDWWDKLGYVAQGYTVAALDARGQGGRSEDKGGVSGNTLRGHIIRGLDDALRGQPEKLLFRQIYLDCAQLARLVMAMPDVDPARVGATGGSQGGALTVACVALEPRVRRAAPVFPFLSDYKRVWEMDQAKDAYAELREFFRLFDPRHEREDRVFETLGYVDIQHLAPRIRADVLWAIGLMDTICPPSSQFAAYNKITSPKTMAIYPDFGHEGLPGMADRIYQFMLGL